MKISDDMKCNLYSVKIIARRYKFLKISYPETEAV